MLLAYACDIRMNGVFKPKQIKYEVEQKLINDKNCIYMYMHIHWTGYSKEAREEE